MTFLHIVLAILINLIFGSMFIAASIGLREFPAVFFTGIRFLLLLIFLAGYIKVPRQQIRPLLKIGLLMGVGVYLTLYLSIALATNTSAIAVFGKLEVPFAMVLGVVLLNEHIGIKRIAGISIAMVGAAVISFDPAAFDNIPALFWMAVSAGLSAYTMIKVRELGKVHPLTITAWVSLVGAPVLLLTSFIFESGHSNVLQHASITGWSALVYTAIASSVIGHSSLFYLLRHYPVSQVMPFSLLSPVFAVIGGVLILGDKLTWALLLGSCLILFGVGWIIKRTRS
ncbi:MAG: DMT family transporter [Thiolinea sp.]